MFRYGAATAASFSVSPRTASTTSSPPDPPE